MNLVKILKDCPKGTALYSLTCGECKLFKVYDNQIKVINNKTEIFTLSEEGKLNNLGECLLFPSKEQRDWNKFRLPCKRGDIMMSSVTERAFIASGDTLNGFPQYICGINDSNYFQIAHENNTILTPEFCIPATEESKRELFDKMAEAGYRWDSNTLELVKIKLKESKVKLEKTDSIQINTLCCFKPFDQVLVKNTNESEWIPALYFKKDNQSYYTIDCLAWDECIPYKGNEDKL